VRLMSAVGYKDTRHRLPLRPPRQPVHSCSDVNPRIGGRSGSSWGTTAMDVLRALYLDLTGSR